MLRGELEPPVHVTLARLAKWGERPQVVKDLYEPPGGVDSPSPLPLP